MIIDSGVRFEFSGRKGTFYWTQVHGKRSEIDGYVDWCLDNFGVDRRENWFYSYKKHTFFFLEKEHQMLFTLRWS